MISCRRTEIRSAHLALKGRPTVGDKGLKTPSSADNRLIDTTQTAREESEIFIRKPEVRDHLQVPDVYFDEQMLLITQAKGGKQRYVPLLPDLTHELRTYLRDRTTGPLFVTIRHTPYSPRRIQQIVQETAALAGITTRVYPHLLRHSVATTLLERGMPLEQIQQFLGHTKLETTQIYAASTTAMIKESYQKALGR